MYRYMNVVCLCLVVVCFVLLCVFSVFFLCVFVLVCWFVPDGYVLLAHMMLELCCIVLL